MSEYTFEKGSFDENELEEAIISLFDGYNYCSGDSMHRDIKDVLIYDELKDYLKYNYPDLDETEVEKCISKLDNIPSVPLYEGCMETHRLLVDGFDLVREDANKEPMHINYIDFDNLENNTYRIINQYTVSDVKTRRPDLIMFINGIPIIIFEFKTAIKEDKTIYDAYIQIHNRYKRDIPKLMKYTLLSVISDGANNRLGTIFTPYKFYSSWNRVDFHDKDKHGLSSLETLIKGALYKERIVKIFRDFVFFPDVSKDEEVIVCRYPQFFASLNMLDSIEKNKKPNGNGKGGVYFGATGCGKTYTMLFLSRLLMQRKKEVFNSPTIVIIVDREDLDDQATKKFIVAKQFLNDNNIRSIETREDLKTTLENIESGGVYITTIQKFCESTGLLSNRDNIICISDEAHRTQTGVEGKEVRDKEKGIITKFGFAYYLRESFPNATYVGFTGTPIDETFAVFGNTVDSYTMKESSDDGITVRISYEPRLARVILSKDEIEKIENYYKECANEGSNEEQIEKSKKAMSGITHILSNPDTIDKLAKDIISHYSELCNEKPKIVQKAMIVCADRPLAFKIYKRIISNDLKPEWAIPKKYSGKEPPKEVLDELSDVPFINMIASRNKDDEKELYNACGNEKNHKFLDEQFKNDNSNFKIAIVVDKWVTGFDVPSLAVMYIYKPLQKHTLIQTISRVNRVFEGKDKGLVVDYIGIKEAMLEAVKLYGNELESPIDEINISIDIFKNHLKLIDNLFVNFDSEKYYNGEPIERLNCLNNATEYIQTSKETEKRFMDLSRKMKAAYNIVHLTGELSKEEIIKAEFYLAIRSILYKQTKGNAPDAEIMNIAVEEMVKNAIACTGVENIIDSNKTIEFFDEDFIKEIDKIKLPITKFNVMLKLLRKAISEFSKINKVKALEFSEMLQKTVDRYNNRDNYVFTSEVVEDFVNNITDELIKIYNSLSEEKKSFEKLGITYEEKAFYDILIKVRDDHKFKFEDGKCLKLAKEIKLLVEDKTKYADFFKRPDIRSQLDEDLTVLLYNNGYPPEWDEEVFEKVMQQAENFKKYSE